MKNICSKKQIKSIVQTCQPSLWEFHLSLTFTLAPSKRCRRDLFRTFLHRADIVAVQIIREALLMIIVKKNIKAAYLVIPVILPAIQPESKAAVRIFRQEESFRNDLRPMVGPVANRIAKNADSESRKTIRVLDSEGNQIGLTYPKRAAGLVKKGRAYYVNDFIIHLSMSDPMR